MQARERVSLVCVHGVGQNDKEINKTRSRKPSLLYVVADCVVDKVCSI